MGPLRFLVGLALLCLTCSTAQALTLTNNSDHQASVKVIGDFGITCFTSSLPPQETISYFPSIIACQSSSLSIHFQGLGKAPSGDCHLRAGSGANISFDGTSCQNESGEGGGTGGHTSPRSC